MEELKEMNDSVSSMEASNGQWDPGYMINIITTICVPLVFGLIVLVGIFGNALVIIVVSTNAQMRSTTNMLILNLAVADMLFILLCVPSTATDYVLNSWPFGLVWCQTVQYLIYATSYVSIYTLILMSIDRYLAVVFPVASLEIRTIKNATWAILVLWTIIAIVTIPVWMSHKLTFTQPNNATTMANESSYEDYEDAVSWCRFDAEDYSESGFHVAFFVSSYAIPLLLIILLYIGMLRRLWNPGSIGNKISKESLRNKRRVTKLVLVVIVVFCVCWAPIQFILLLKAKGLYTTKPPEDYPRIIFQIFAHVLAYLNSCINPILYAFLSENFRKAFHNLMPCFSKLRRGPTHPGHHALRYELTTMKSSTRGRRSLRDIRRKKKPKQGGALTDHIDMDPSGPNGAVACLNQDLNSSLRRNGHSNAIELQSFVQNHMKQEAIERKQPELKLVVEQHKEEEKASLVEKNESTSSEEKSADLIERPDNKELPEAPNDEAAMCEDNEVIEKPDEEEKDEEEQGKPLCTNL